ncbi:hypothetical protein FQZ97_989290 [compost metagenome]
MLSKIGRQLLLEGTTGLDEKRSVNCFVRDVHFAIFGELALEPSRNLLGRPAQSELDRDFQRKRGVALQVTALGPLGPVPGSFVGTDRAISAMSTIALDLSRDGTGTAGQPCRDQAYRFAHRESTRDLLTLTQRQGARRATALSRGEATCLADPCLYRGHRAFQRHGDLGDPLALLPSIPDLPLLRSRRMNSLTCALRQLTPRFVFEVLHRRVEPAGAKRGTFAEGSTRWPGHAP